MTARRDLVQIRNPKTDRYVKIDRGAGKILSHKRSPGPYKNIPVVGGERDADHNLGKGPQGRGASPGKANSSAGG